MLNNKQISLKLTGCLNTERIIRETWLYRSTTYGNFGGKQDTRLHFHAVLRFF